MTKLLLGSYSGSKADGLRLLSFDDATGELSVDRVLEGAPDVSFLARDGGRLYVTDEFGPRVGAFDIAEDFTSMSPVGYQPSLANSPCYLALSPNRSLLAAADYGADIVEVYQLADGALLPEPQVLRGTGADAEGHAHWVQWSPEGDRLYVVDLGHDEVRMHTAGVGELGPATTAFRTPAKAGPRHLAFHRDFAYLMTEYANTLTALRRGADGILTELQTVPTLPADYAETSFGAHIQIVRDVVYVSNRGHNSIASFSIGVDGRLAPLQTISCGGDWPRFFLVLGKHMIVANQKSDSLVVFDVSADGTLRETGTTLAVPRPVALLVV
jgi:6-phosphogluconolactonase